MGHWFGVWARPASFLDALGQNRCRFPEEADPKPTAEPLCSGSFLQSLPWVSVYRDHAPPFQPSKLEQLRQRDLNENKGIKRTGSARRRPPGGSGAQGEAAATSESRILAFSLAQEGQ